MIARHAKNLRVTANARAKYLSTHYLELASACEGAIVKNKQQLDKIKAEIVAGSNNAFLRPEALKKKTQQITKLKFSLHQMSNRLQRLKAAAEKSSQLSERGLATICFGGKKLASAVHRVDTCKHFESLCIFREIKLPCEMSVLSDQNFNTLSERLAVAGCGVIKKSTHEAKGVIK
jgi:hypothetical protein